MSIRRYAETVVKWMKAHWIIFVLVVITVLFVEGNVYRSHIKEEKKRKEEECVNLMQWFDPYVTYDAIKAWNKNGVRGWGEWWSEENYDLIEEAIKADEKEKEEVKSNALLLLNGSFDSDSELDICSMDVLEFSDAVWYIGEIAQLENLIDKNGKKISETDIIRMWWSINRKRNY